MGDTFERHDQWTRQLYQQRPEPTAVQCEATGGGERCPEVAVYTVRLAHSAWATDDRDICEACLLTWVHNATEVDQPVLVRRYRPERPPEPF